MVTVAQVSDWAMVLLLISYSTCTYSFIWLKKGLSTKTWSFFLKKRWVWNIYFAQSQVFKRKNYFKKVKLMSLKSHLLEQVCCSLFLSKWLSLSFSYVLEFGKTGFGIPVAHVELYNSTIELRKVVILCSLFIQFLIIRLYVEAKYLSVSTCLPVFLSVVHQYFYLCSLFSLLLKIQT